MTENFYTRDSRDGENYRFLFEDDEVDDSAETKDKDISDEMCNGLKTWALQYNISENSLTDLLQT